MELTVDGVDAAFLNFVQISNSDTTSQRQNLGQTMAPKSQPQPQKSSWRQVSSTR